MLRICALAIIGCSFAALSHGQPILTMSSSLIPPPAIFKRDASPSNPVQKQNQKPLFRLVEDGDEEVRPFDVFKRSYYGFQQLTNYLKHLVFVYLKKSKVKV